MPQQIILEKFSGPLELLLELIEQRRLSITEISLAAVTEQFLAYLDTVAEDRPEALADFLVVGARLVYLKSRALLPELVTAEAEEGLSLANQLKLYQQYAAASRLVAARWEAGEVAYGRTEPRQTMTVFLPPPRLSAAALGAALRSLLARLRPLLPLPEVAVARGVSLKETVASLWEAVRRLRRLKFSELFQSGRNRTEVIVSFLAILELVKERRVAIKQQEIFGDLLVERA